jgi:hypothetical protein
MSEGASDLFVDFLMLVVLSLIFTPFGVPLGWCFVFGLVLSAPLWILTIEDLIQATRRARNNRGQRYE